jgi:hypothetical protein
MAVFAEHVSLLLFTIMNISAFLALFFFTFGKRLEKQCIERELDDITRPLVLANIIFNHLPFTDDIVTKLQQRMQDDDMLERDRAVEMKNRRLQCNVATVVGSAYAMMTCVVIALSYAYNFKLLPVVVTGLYTIVVVGIVYTIFVSYFVTKYQAIDSNIIVQLILSRMAGDDAPTNK